MEKKDVSCFGPLFKGHCWKFKMWALFWNSIQIWCLGVLTTLVVWKFKCYNKSLFSTWLLHHSGYVSWVLQSFRQILSFYVEGHVLKIVGLYKYILFFMYTKHTLSIKLQTLAQILKLLDTVEFLLSSKIFKLHESRLC